MKRKYYSGKMLKKSVGLIWGKTPYFLRTRIIRATQPKFTVSVAAIITNEKEHLLLQLRPTTSRHAPGQLTCFGGRREKNESMESCLQRELTEELKWTPTLYSFACDLWQGDTFIASFFY